MSMKYEKGGDVEKKRINFEVSEEQHRQLKTRAAQEGKTIKEIVIDALKKIFPDWEKDK